jgi:hypothetical protein
MASTMSNCQRCAGLVKQISDQDFKPLCDTCAQIEPEPKMGPEPRVEYKAKGSDYRSPRRKKATGVD